MGCGFHRHQGAVMSVKNAHCNAGNISDRRLVVFADCRKRVRLFHLATSQHGRNGCCNGVGCFRRGLSVPVTDLMWVCGFYRHHGTVVRKKLVLTCRKENGATTVVFVVVVFSTLHTPQRDTDAGFMFAARRRLLRPCLTESPIFWPPRAYKVTT
jgi:hypothetical protein